MTERDPGTGDIGPADDTGLPGDETLADEELENEPAEICAVLGLTQGNLRALLYRARMQLRHCLELNWER